jgi:hypothetical protein
MRKPAAFMMPRRATLRVARFLWRAERTTLMYRLGLGLAALCVLACTALAARIAVLEPGAGIADSGAAVAGRLSPMALVALLATKALAWGPGALVCFTVATRVYERDRAQGRCALIEARGLTADYPWARIFATVVAIATPVSIGTLLMIAISALIALRGSDLASALRGGMPALAYATAFCLVLGPLMVALLAHRPRGSGYLAILSVLVLPELLAPVTRTFVPQDMTSIPAALEGLAQALAPAQGDARRALGCALFLTAIALMALATAHRNAQIAAKNFANAGSAMASVLS